MTARHCATLLAVAALAAPASAEDIPFRGSEGFRFALHNKKIQPLTDARDALADPASTMIILLGDTNRLGGVLNGDAFRDYVRAGGAILIATDTQTPSPFALPRTWAHAFGITITGEKLAADPRQCYDENPNRPFVAPRPRVGDNKPSPFDLFEGLGDNRTNRVATFGPSEMSVKAPPGFRTKNLAGYPPGTIRRRDGQAIEPSTNHFALSVQPEPANDWLGPGRLLVLANRGVLFNGMMGFRRAEQGYVQDNANWEFANRTIDWLKGGFPDPRTRCLFIEDGRVQDKFADEIPQPPKPPIPNIPPDVLANILLNHSNGVINELQEKNFFNRAMEGFFGFPRIVRAFLLAATILFLFYAFRWLARGHRKLEPAATTGPAQQAALLPRGGVLRQRTAAQIEVGNLSEAAGRRVRDRFDVLGGRPGPAGGMPPVLIATDVADALLLRQTVRRLWEIGYGETPINVPPTDWDRVNGLLERVTARASRGDWSFGQDVA